MYFGSRALSSLTEEQARFQPFFFPLSGSLTLPTSTLAQRTLATPRAQSAGFLQLCLLCCCAVVYHIPPLVFISHCRI